MSSWKFLIWCVGNTTEKDINDINDSNLNSVKYVIIIDDIIIDSVKNVNIVNDNINSVTSVDIISDIIIHKVENANINNIILNTVENVNIIDDDILKSWMLILSMIWTWTAVGFEGWKKGKKPGGWLRDFEG